MRNRRIFSILLCMVMLTAVILPVRADDRIYWHDDANKTLTLLGVYAYFEVTITGSGPNLSAETTLTFIPNSPYALPQSSYKTKLRAYFVDNNGHDATVITGEQTGMQGQFSIQSINSLFNDGDHLSSAECKFFVNNANRCTINLPGSSI